MSTSNTIPAVVRTMYWTLKPRSDEHHRKDRLFSDPLAVEWFAQVGQQEPVGSWYSDYFQFTIAVRVHLIDQAVRRFLNHHKEAAIIELGCGLSTRHARVDLSPTGAWVYVDLPEAMAVRRTLADPSPGVEWVAASALDPGWAQAVPTCPTLIIAEGLSMFLTPAEQGQLLAHLQDRFPGGTLVMDVAGQDSKMGEARIALEEGIPMPGLVTDEGDITRLGLSITDVWPLMFQYPERFREFHGAMPAQLDETRNALLLIEGRLISDSPEPAGEIRVYSQSYHADKRFRDGTHRTCAPSETLARIAPHYSRVGITRVANITTLDRIGVPVTLVVRPNAPTMSNSTGKGVTMEAAIVSGAMESIEIFHAENVDLSIRKATYEQLAAESDVIPFDRLPLQKYALFAPHSSETWVAGWDLMNGCETFVPSAMVVMTAIDDQLGTLSFQVGSNGLASGNHLLEAITAGLLEVIERDAITTWKTAWGKLGIPPPRIDPTVFISPSLHYLLQRLENSEIDLWLWNCTLDIAVPVFQAQLVDRKNSKTGIVDGYGAHLDPEVAAMRAITEAIQARAVVIAGSRDEFFRDQMVAWQKFGHSPSAVATIEQVPFTAFQPIDQSTATFEGDIAILLDHLQAANIHRAIVVDLSRPDFDISVVRVLVPGLEGYLFKYYTPGFRAQRFIYNRYQMLKATSLFD